MAHPHHFLMVTYPVQGHINPALQLAKRLVSKGATVTFAITVSAHRRMSQTILPKDITFLSFSDGYDNGFQSTSDDHMRYLSEFRRCGSKSIEEAIVSSANDGHPVTCVLYTLLLPWAAEVARSLHVPSALVWIQPATVLGMFYYYFNGYGDIIDYNSDHPSWSIELPGLPLLTARDFPSFLSPKSTYSFALPSFAEQLQALGNETNPKVLVNTFDALESEALRALNKFNLIAIGPLIPSAFLDGEDPSDTSFGGDIFQQTKEYTTWINSKPESSVIYISFGSLSMMSKHQNEEIAKALLKRHYPFLWVIRASDDGEKNDEVEMSSREELEQQGMIVPWCSQVEVLSHASVGCFITHCGWNSSLECLVSGVPVVGFPQWADQPANAKLIEDVWGMGVRLKVNEEGIVESDEIMRCLELVMGDGERGEEMRKNAKKWKHLAVEAVKEGGSSDMNLRAFINQLP